MLDNIGLPVSGINLSYNDSGAIGSADADILVSLNPGHRPTPEYVRRLRLLIAGSGGKQLFHLAQSEKLRVYVRVPEPDAPGVSPGQSAELMVSQVPGRVFPVKVITTSD